MLSLPVTAKREDTLARDQFRDWIAMHIESWFAFTQKYRLGVKMEDIVLVTGCHRTKSWSNIAFNEVRGDTQFSLGVDVPSVLSAGIDWRVSRLTVPGALHNHGPNGKVRVTDFRGHRILLKHPRGFFRAYLRINAYLFEDFERNELFSGYRHGSKEQRNPNQG